jgi:hypothetical protein
MPKHTDEQMLAAIRRVIEESAGDTAARTYSSLRRATEPALRTIINHLGTWGAAVAAACEGAKPVPEDAMSPAERRVAAVDELTRESERLGLYEVRVKEPFVAAMGGAETKAGLKECAPRDPGGGHRESKVDIHTAKVSPASKIVDAQPLRDPVDIGVVRRLRSRLTVTIGDVHRNSEHVLFLRAFLSFVAHVRPHRVIWNGDLLESGGISRYKQSPDADVHVIDEVRSAVEMIEYCRKRSTESVVIWGNHDTQRWDEYILGANPTVLRGAKGLSLEDQFRAHGMHSDVKCIEQSATCAGFWINDTRVRHGHKQAGSRFGAGKQLAQKYLDEVWGSSITNHHHRAGLAARTVTGPNGKRRTHVSILNGCAELPQNFAPDGDWQWSFVATEEHAPHFTGQSHLLVIADPETGEFSYGGVTYCGMDAAA